MNDQRGDFDSPWKLAIEQYFIEFIAFFFPAVYDDIDWSKGYQFLDKELQQVVRDAELGRRFADKLVRVYRKSGEAQWVLIHVEIQGWPGVGFGRRMYTYNYRIFDNHNQLVASFAIFGDAPAERDERHFGYDLWGCEISFKYAAVNLQDYMPRWAELEASSNAFATLVMAHLKALATQDNNLERRGWKLHLLRGLYKKGYGRERIIALFRFIDWILNLPEEMETSLWHEVQAFEEEKTMEYLASFERFAIKRGFEKGHEEGREEGLQRGALRQLLRLLQHRFGPSSAEVEALLQPFAAEQLEELLDVALTVDSLENFKTNLAVLSPQKILKEPTSEPS